MPPDESHAVGMFSPFFGRIGLRVPVGMCAGTQYERQRVAFHEQRTLPRKRAIHHLRWPLALVLGEGEPRRDLLP